VPNFLVPFADSLEQSEQVYQKLVQNSGPYPLLASHSRLYEIQFRHKNKHLVATVGKEISHWPEDDGEVLAIIETTNFVLIHTVVRGGYSSTPILVSTDEACGRVYFDDYPAR
jgi:hypothetical protein